MNNESRRLIDNQQPLILKQDLECDLFGGHQIVWGFEQGHGDHFACKHSLVRRGDRSVNRDLTRSHQSVDPP